MPFVRRLFEASTPFTPAVLFLLLITLATLQYRWAGALSEAEGARLRASARMRADALGRDFDRELTRAFQHLQLEPDMLRSRDFTAYAREHARWRAESPWPGLVKEVLLVEREPAGSGMARVSRFDLAQATFAPIPWPAELAALRERLSGRGRPAGLVVPEVPAVIVPVPAPPPPALRGAAPPPAPWGPRDDTREIRRPERGFRARDIVVLVLDVAYVRDRVLPALAERHFGGPHGLDYELTVTTTDDPPRLVWRSDGAASPPGDPDATSELLQLRFEGAERAGWRPPFGDRAMPPPPEGPGWWRLLAVHRGGTIARAVDIARRRNLAVSFGILLLLGASALVLVTAARRAERLARQRVEFVAGVTHDLRTPLAVIRSAGENLADGLVRDAAQVRSYGALVRDEGRRLTEMVEDVLELAGADAGRPRRREPVDVAALLEATLRACEPQVRGAGIAVETSVPASLPRVLGDERALGRAVRNLLENAIQYGGDERWIGVQAGAAGRDREREVWVAVEDRGPGIPPEDVARIFEPFYRGSHAMERRAGGSGLGLALVRRIAETHGGSVTVERGRERGAVFTIRLPAADRPEAP